MPRGGLKLAVATTSALAADAAAETADEGGNAVDCAVAASLVAMNTEPGVCALAGGAYVTVWPASGTPCTIDGGVAVPGHEQSSAYAPNNGTTVTMEYGGGVDTIVGCASVAVPGSLAACDRAVEKFGLLPLATSLRPSIRAAAAGFPLPSACHHYLQYSGRPVFGRSADGFAALHNEGELRGVGENIVVPHLADSLSAIAEHGAREFYEGNIAREIADHVRDGGGRLTLADLANYQPHERAALEVPFAGWTLALNPPPAIGGAMLAAMLLPLPARSGDTQEVIRAQEAAMRYRLGELDYADDAADAVARLLDSARAGALPQTERSAATVHTSAVDSSGLACAITSSAGYGSGEMPAGTGLWLNNCLGELELNRRGLDASPCGSRLPSNMAPGIARQRDCVMAFGSPGADRITTALQQFLRAHLAAGEPLASANAAPRLHVEISDGSDLSVSAEQGLALDETAFAVNRYPAHSMYFGGVGAAVFDPQTGLDATADPRRVGGVFVSD